MIPAKNHAPDARPGPDDWQFAGDFRSPNAKAQYFPVQLDHMGANFEFLQIADASKHFTSINNVRHLVTAQSTTIPAERTVFRVERNGRVLAVCMDVEHGEQIDPRLVELAREADLLVH
jgi:hypothetical protein